LSARPATRRTTTAEPAANPRVRNFSGGQTGPVIEWDVRTAYDFVFSLSDDAGSTDDLPEADQTWLRDQKAELRRITGDAIDRFPNELTVVLAGLAVAHPTVTDAAAFVELIRTSDDPTIMRTIASDDLRDPAVHDTVERAIAGDDRAIEHMIERTKARHDARMTAWATAFYRDPGSIIEPTREVLTAWLPMFQTIESRVRTMLERDHRARAADRETLDAAALIERTTGGVRWMSEPGVGRLILAPSYFSRPYNFLLGGGDWRLFGYPIADEALDGLDPMAPPAGLLRLHRALGDETRLRILRLLRDRDLYLTELAQLLDLSKPTIKHHLTLLRSAGLVTVTEAGSVLYYSLRPTRLDDASSEVKHFLLG
jgi:DNA-binding transcriptional ArsR family regulator